MAGDGAGVQAVDILLPVETAQTEIWAVALSIPHTDIQRLSIRPFKWLRFVTFAVSDSPGDLSTTPPGGPVDYENTTSIENLAKSYYYNPQGDSED